MNEEEEYPLFESKDSTVFNLGPSSPQSMPVWELYSDPKMGPWYWRHSSHSSVRIMDPGAGKLAPPLKVIATLAKDSDVIPSTHIAAHDPATVTVSEDLMPSSHLPGIHMVYINTCRQNTRTCKIKQYKIYRTARPGQRIPVTKNIKNKSFKTLNIISC